MQNQGTARHSVHGFVEKSCGGGRVSSTGLLTDQLLIVILISVEAGHSFHSLLTFQRIFSRLVFAVLCASDLEILAGQKQQRMMRKQRVH